MMMNKMACLGRREQREAGLKVVNELGEKKLAVAQKLADSQRKQCREKLGID